MKQVIVQSLLHGEQFVEQERSTVRFVSISLAINPINAVLIARVLQRQLGNVAH